MKAFLIDPYTKTISEVEHDGNYKSIYPLISTGPHQVETFSVATLEDGDAIFVDDEGFLGDMDELEFFCVYNEGRHSGVRHICLGGKGLVLGSDSEGDSCAPKITLRELLQRVRWLDHALGATLAERLVANSGKIVSFESYLDDGKEQS